MKTALVRTGSVPVLSPPPGSPSSSSSFSSFSNFKPFSGVFSCQKSSVSSPRSISLHSDINHRKGTNSSNIIRRSFSETDISRSLRSISNCSGSRFFSSMTPEEQEIGISGSGIGIGGGDIVTKTFVGGGNDRSKIGAYYREMLKLNPSDSLILRNYGKFLHEVENDRNGAEECYGRAILANPGDGELLSLYGKLVWEIERDEDRAHSYFDLALTASPDDCSVLGSYAHFLWEVDTEEEEEEKRDQISPALVTAF